MKKKYKQLNQEQRYQIEVLLEAEEDTDALAKEWVLKNPVVL